jgi:hypothetical protein
MPFNDDWLNLEFAQWFAERPLWAKISIASILMAISFAFGIREPLGLLLMGLFMTVGVVAAEHANRQ